MSQNPTEQSSKDRTVQEVADKVEQRPSVDVPRADIEARAGQAVDGLAEQPVQTFTPLLAENEVLGDILAEDHDGPDDAQGEKHPA